MNLAHNETEMVKVSKIHLKHFHPYYKKENLAGELNGCRNGLIRQLKMTVSKKHPVKEFIAFKGQIK